MKQKTSRELQHPLANATQLVRLHKDLWSALRHLVRREEQMWNCTPGVCWCTDCVKRQHRWRSICQTHRMLAIANGLDPVIPRIHHEELPCELREEFDATAWEALDNKTQTRLYLASHKLRRRWNVIVEALKAMD